MVVCGGGDLICGGRERQGKQPLLQLTAGAHLCSQQHTTLHTTHKTTTTPKHQTKQSHRALCDGVSALARRVQSDRELTNLIRRKFAIKCTTGYSLNALVDFPADDPIEVIKHLMIGSEGTLGFVSRATYNTVPEWPHKASAFIVFPDVRAACRAASILRDETAVDAVELFDR